MQMTLFVSNHADERNWGLFFVQTFNQLLRSTTHGHAEVLALAQSRNISLTRLLIEARSRVLELQAVFSKPTDENAAAAEEFLLAHYMVQLLPIPDQDLTLLEQVVVESDVTLRDVALMRRKWQAKLTTSQALLLRLGIDPTDVLADPSLAFSSLLSRNVALLADLQCKSAYLVAKKKENGGRALVTVKQRYRGAMGQGLLSFNGLVKHYCTVIDPSAVIPPLDVATVLRLHPFTTMHPLYFYQEQQQQLAGDGAGVSLPVLWKIALVPSKYAAQLKELYYRQVTMDATFNKMVSNALAQLEAITQLRARIVDSVENDGQSISFEGATLVGRARADVETLRARPDAFFGTPLTFSSALAVLAAIQRHVNATLAQMKQYSSTVNDWAGKKKFAQRLGELKQPCPLVAFVAGWPAEIAALELKIDTCTAATVADMRRMRVQPLVEEALPAGPVVALRRAGAAGLGRDTGPGDADAALQFDNEIRKSTRLNSSHSAKSRMPSSA
jgi:hypothetical protein